MSPKSNAEWNVEAWKELEQRALDAERKLERIAEHSAAVLGGKERIWDEIYRHALESFALRILAIVRGEK